MILKELIKTEYKTLTQFGHIIGLSPQALSYKFKKNAWSLKEVEKICMLFNKDFNDIEDFTTKQYKMMIKRLNQDLNK